ncbi:MAG: GNAT family N-acetyltransferase [Clostridiales bacterium]|nr:GNAT family N-acetyltransferase [Clostridiales bacterium]
MSQLSFRYAHPEDAQELLRIYGPYVKNTAITFEYEIPTVSEFNKRVETTLKSYPYLVALSDGKIIGYAYGSQFHPRAAYAWSAEVSIYLDRKARGMGIGRTLYQHLEEVLKKQNILNLNACIASSATESIYLTDASEKFHRAMGYQLVGRFHQCGYKFDQWFDMIWMEKIIGMHSNTPPQFIPFSQLK